MRKFLSLLVLLSVALLAACAAPTPVIIDFQVEVESTSTADTIVSEHAIVLKPEVSTEGVCVGRLGNFPNGEPLVRVKVKFPGLSWNMSKDGEIVSYSSDEDQEEISFALSEGNYVFTANYGNGLSSDETFTLKAVGECPIYPTPTMAVTTIDIVTDLLPIGGKVGNALTITTNALGIVPVINDTCPEISYTLMYGGQDIWHYDLLITTTQTLTCEVIVIVSNDIRHYQVNITTMSPVTPVSHAKDITATYHEIFDQTEYYFALQNPNGHSSAKKVLAAPAPQVVTDTHKVYLPGVWRNYQTPLGELRYELPANVLSAVNLSGRDIVMTLTVSNGINTSTLFSSKASMEVHADKIICYAQVGGSCGYIPNWTEPTGTVQLWIEGKLVKELILPPPPPAKPVKAE